ncbi:MAG: GNAT family N-acetyltransferase [Microgenomates group bacterium]
MDNFKFLQDYEQLQHTIMFDRFVDLGFAVVSYCRGDDSVFWNHALTSKHLLESELTKIETAMRSLGRKPAVYFENTSRLQSLVGILKNNKYKFSFEDSWMFHPGKKVDKSRFGQVKKITSESQLKVFLKVFDACYQKGDPQNAYGELGDYLKVAEKVWRRHHKTNRLEYFLVHSGDKPVAVSTLTNYNGIGYISNVGSLKEVRGKGFGKVATNFCVEQSKKRGNKNHCLATEEGTYANEFYKRAGFVTKFTAVGYLKEEK